MTISLYSGTPGSGKSLDATDRIRRRLKRGLPVIANYALDRSKIPNPELFHFVDNEDLTPSFLAGFACEWFRDHPFGEDRVLIVIDECQLLFNSRDWRDKARPAWLSFFQQHRHMGFSILLIAQYSEMIDKQIRANIEYEYLHRKVSNFGIVGWLLSLFVGGKAHVCIQRYYPTGSKLGTRWFIARKRVFQMYDSYAMFDRIGTRQPELLTSAGE